jgi:hypothetical protein
MKCHNFEFEKLHIPKAISLTFQGFDFIVGIFKRSR